MVKLRIDSNPPGAHVYRGEERLGVTPLELEEPRAEGALELVLSLGGHPDGTVELSTLQDGSVLHEFVPIVRPAIDQAPATRKPAAPKPKRSNLD
jgi:hypothetical protein